MEQRKLSAELRSELTGNTLAGHAAVFGQVARIGAHYEQLAPTAFDRALEEDDPVFVYDHNDGNVLGRKSAGTLRLHKDDKGLAFELDLPDTTLGRDIKELVGRGDLKDMSFRFLPGEEKWERAADGRQLNTHISIKRLMDLSLVAFPAYDGTEARLRSFVIEPVDKRTQIIRARFAALQLPNKGGNLND